MRQRLTVLILGVLGAVLIALGIASATVWRADDVLAAKTTADAGTTLLVTDPGVLSLAGHPVTVTASVPGSGAVVIAIGRDTDVNGWVGSERVTRVTGLSGWHTLAVAPPTTASPTTSTPAASPSVSPAVAAASPTVSATAAAGVPGTTTTPAGPDPTGSDMWVAQATGTGRATLTWPVEPGRWMLLVAATGADAAPPTVQLAWPQTVSTPWLIPGVVAGSILVLVALWLLLRAAMRSRGGLAVSWHAIETDELATAGAPEVSRTERRAASNPGARTLDGAAPGAPLTRRQLRERERTAPTPVVVPKLSLRRRDPEVSTGEPSIAAAPGAPARGWEPEPTTPAVEHETDAASERASRSTSRRPETDVQQSGAVLPDQPAGGRRWRRDRAVAPEPEQAAPPPAEEPTSVVPTTVDTGADGDGTTSGTSGPAQTMAAPGGGARADAWRRAWGFPGVGDADPPGGAGGSEADPGATTDNGGRT
ncbi:hypothetical protein GALL_405260 [mine drainage metagenome]|uniref:Uncharacterized protein n=1 Tax=mine drainage metagenome TaxID=410659 RepID=A0A1J5QP96_9ZZZZ